MKFFKFLLPFILFSCKTVYVETSFVVQDTVWVEQEHFHINYSEPICLYIEPYYYIQTDTLYGIVPK